MALYNLYLINNIDNIKYKMSSKRLKANIWPTTIAATSIASERFLASMTMDFAWPKLQPSCSIWCVSTRIEWPIIGIPAILELGPVWMNSYHGSTQICVSILWRTSRINGYFPICSERSPTTDAWTSWGRTWPRRWISLRNITWRMNGLLLVTRRSPWLIYWHLVSLSNWVIFYCS